jgi:DNA-binding transcriptional regulator GbsR (MarR family)
MGFKWGQELLKAKQIIKEQDECCGILNKINDDIKEENEELKQEIKELRKDYLEMHSEYKDYYDMTQQLIKELKQEKKL